ncbi:hypothetical protein CFBP6625_03395 [Agrobacterium tumefaciens]|nr:hypothetical protein CFBP6625_03395 [Agrobacterium tumefaciens]
MKFYLYILLAILFLFFSPIILSLLADVIAYVYGCQINLEELNCSAGGMFAPTVAVFALNMSLFALRLVFFMPLIATMFFFIWLLLILRYALLKSATKSK